jgi:hypothetical protein
MKQSLPIGIQTFANVREKGSDFLYVDKTEQIYRLAQKRGYYFLSRPRRFGKSLICSTLESLFTGQQEFFEDLYVYDKWNWKETFPVIRMDMSGTEYSDIDAVKRKLIFALRENEETHQITLDEENPGGRLKQLIERIYKKYNKQVVIIIDEYDKAIQDTLSNEDNLAEASMNALRGFYSAIKASDAYIRFAFMTGITKFAGMGLFSGANNFKDISLSPAYGTICGFTKKELETCFGSHFDNKDMEEVLKWYNGYNFLSDKVCNPFDILLYLDEDVPFYRNYWWETGQPGFLVKLFKKEKYLPQDLGNLELRETQLKNFTLNNLNLASLLWQTGYLTIKEYTQAPGNQLYYYMSFPNLEVQLSLNDLFFESMTSTYAGDHKQKESLYALHEGNLEALKEGLYELLANIPHQNYTKNDIEKYEGYYAGIVFTFLTSLGFKCYPERSHSKGRIDLTVETDHYIYVIEFKMEGGKNALEQIRENKYHEPFLNQGKQIILVGMHFDKKKRNLSVFETERYEIQP